MSAGNFYIRQNKNDTSSVPNAGTNLDSNWDELVYKDGNIVTYTNPYFRLNTGLYLIMYSENFHTSDTTNNERIEIQGEIHINGVGAVGGYGSDYIRKSSGQQECIVSSYMFLDVTSDNTDIFIRFYRTDNSTTGTVNRVPGYGGVQIIEMDDTNHNFGFYSTSSSENTSGTNARTLNINTNNKQDTGFSRSGNIITISNSGRYLMTYNLDISMTSTARENIRAWISRNGTTDKVVGSQSHSYMRGNDGCQDSALAWIGIVDVNSGDTFQIRWDVPTSATITAAAGATFQIWQIPSIGDECIIEATTGNYNADADFKWDTIEHIDTNSFDAITGSTTLNIKDTYHILTFATFSHIEDTSTPRAYPFVRFKHNDNIVNYAVGGAYQRYSSTHGCAITVASIITEINTYLEVYTKPYGASGTLTNISGQFSALNLESIWDYTYTPIISATTQTQISTNEVNIKIYGRFFKSSQGTGKVEIGNSTGYTSSTILVEQSIDSWNNTQIQFDFIQSGLTNGYAYIFITNSDSIISEGYKIIINDVSYSGIINNMLPDHYWALQNNYNDDGHSSDNRPMVSENGSPIFTGITLVYKNSYSLYFNNIDIRNNCADVSDMNTSKITERTMGGWIQLGGYQKPLGAIYKEGGPVNNYAFLIGFGNKLMAQLADTNDDNVQSYSDFNLIPDRPYHILFRMSYKEKEFKLFIDGVEQSISDGNPLTSTDMDSHSGDINWGDPDNNLEMGGTDIAFKGQEDILYSNWYTWTKSLDKREEIKVNLFELGAVPIYEITGITSTEMQNTLNMYSNTKIDDVPLGFKIHKINNNNNITLIADNITFDDRCSLNIQWLGTGTLTWTNINGSSIDENKISTPFKGKVVVYNPPILKISGLKNNSEVRIYESGTTNEVAGVELTGGTYSTNIFVDFVDVQIVSINFVVTRFEKVDMRSGDVELPIEQEKDRVYFNP